MKRLFVAVLVSEEVKERIKPVVDELSKTGADLKIVSLSHLHFTLKFLGDVDEKKIPEVTKRLAGIAERMKSFEISLKGVGVFPCMERISVVWIGIEDSELVSLMKKVSKELAFVRKNDHEEEIAHLTIARVKSTRNKKELQEFVKRFEKKEFGRMIVDKLILFESELRKEGAVHKVVREFRLG
ncbi:MAG: RNA 2',3'-cyclic phosphodiesterase [Nanoarchaeota archaeon]|nr:RNA 2',3'-cyclic phosphodiesterase [Nanoarchaeota archaeon]